MALYIKNEAPDYHTISTNYSCYMATFSNGAITTLTGIGSVSLAVSIQSKFTELTNLPQIFVYFK